MRAHTRTLFLCARAAALVRTVRHAKYPHVLYTLDIRKFAHIHRLFIYARSVYFARCARACVGICDSRAARSLDLHNNIS